MSVSIVILEPPLRIGLSQQRSKVDPCGTSACSEKGGCQLKRRNTNLKCILQLFLDLDLRHMLSKHTTSLPLNVNECPAHTSRRPGRAFSTASSVSYPPLRALSCLLFPLSFPIGFGCFVQSSFSASLCPICSVRPIRFRYLPSFAFHSFQAVPPIHSACSVPFRPIRRCYPTHAVLETASKTQP